MAVLAMGLLGVGMCRSRYLLAVLALHPRRGSPHVDTRRHRLEVVGIHTGLVAAEMVQVEAFGNRTNQGFPNQSVGPVDASLPIPVSVFGAGPLPTVTHINGFNDWGIGAALGEKVYRHRPLL